MCWESEALQARMSTDCSTGDCYVKCTKELLGSAEARWVILMKRPMSF